LVLAAQGLGREGEVAEAQRELDELQASDPRFGALDARLAAVLNGEDPKDNTERLALARRAYDRKRHALAARLWAEALETDPNLAADRQAQHPYNAACAAALAASGEDIADPPPDQAAKLKLRQQAHGWLRSELAAWSKLVESGPPQAKAFVVQTLGHWRNDADLVSVREAEALEVLPEAERVAWQALWAEVGSQLERAREKTP
jgi:hypothetical protein